MESPLKTFIIYSHEDAAFRKGLEKYLSHLVRMNKVTIWTDKEIQAGEIWNDAIQMNLAAAELILMLVSVDFYNSDYIQNIEFEQAKARHNKGDVLLIPILVRNCPYHSYELIKDLKILPTDERGLIKPIKSWGNNEDDAYTNVAEEIEIAVEKMLQARAKVERDKIIAAQKEEGRKRREAEAAQKLEEQKREDAEKRAEIETEKAQNESKAKEVVVSDLNRVRKSRTFARVVGAVIGVLALISGSLSLLLYQEKESLRNNYMESSKRLYETSSEGTDKEKEINALKVVIKKEKDTLNSLRLNALKNALRYYNQPNKRVTVNRINIADYYLSSVGLDSIKSKESIENHISSFEKN